MRRLPASFAALLGAAAVLVRLSVLRSTGWQYDEIVYSQVASYINDGHGLTEKIPLGQPYQPFLYQPPWYPHLLAVWFAVAGQSITSARVLGVGLSACSIALCCVLAYRLHGVRAAWVAGIALAFDSWLVYVQHISYIENLILALTCLGMVLYERALSTGRATWFASAGAVLALAVCFKYTAVYVILAVLLCWLIVHRDHRKHLLALGVMLIVLTVDQIVLIGVYGSAYTSETLLQVRRVLGLQPSGGTLSSPGQLIHLLLAQYVIYLPSFLVGVAGIALLVMYLIRCYRARDWRPVQYRALLFSWSLAGCVVFGLSGLRYPQYFALVLVPLYLLFWTWLCDHWQNAAIVIVGAAAGAGIAVTLASAHAQDANPLQQVQQYAQHHIPRSAVVVADEQVGDLIPQRYCREQVAAACAGRASYVITWNTYLQQTAAQADAAYKRIDVGARPVWKASGFSGTVTVWKLSPQPAADPGPVLGVDVEADRAYSPAAASLDGQRLASYIHGSLHAASLGLVWDYCQPSFGSDAVGRCAETLSARDAAVIAGDAQRDGMSVQFRPLIRVGPVSVWFKPGLSWEGFIRPDDQGAWFAHLLAADRPYLEVLRHIPGSQFVAATELDHMATAPGWPAFLQDARAICRCSVTMSAFDHQYAAGLFPPVSHPGVDWYPEQMHLATGASQAAVTRAFEASLDGVPARILAATTMEEESIRATAGAYNHPQDWNEGGAPDPAVQVRYFTAACHAVRHYRMAGLYFYMIPLDDNPGRPTAFPAYFVDNAGSRAIANCARILGDG